jgi:hypothetical protein
LRDFIGYLKWLLNIGPKCEHKRLRCLHGDEIVTYNWQRSACLDCFALFPDLPEYCYYTKDKH